MDLCLAENWKAQCGSAFRDDLGPQVSPPAPHAFVCGLRDWRAAPVPRKTPFAPALRGGRKPAAPVLVPYQAPGWLRGTRLPSGM